MMLIPSLFTFVAGLAITQTAHPSQNPKQKQTLVQVRGCLHGQTLTISDDPSFDLPGRKLDLKGDRRTMRSLKEHDGHQEEVIGTLRDRNPDGVTAIKEKRGDTTRIYVGVGVHTSSPAIDEMVTPVLEVRELKHIASTCGGAP